MLDGLLFESYAVRGWQNIVHQEKKINDMNVFPVSDGDTGTNMRLTVENGLRYAGQNHHLGQYMDRFARGTLLGARGNSGVIFSQLIKGMAESLHGKETATATDMAEALLNASRTAYSAVVHPVEGTVLTVAREAAEYLFTLPLEQTEVITLRDCYWQKIKESLAATPLLLPVLREAGVVDSGAYALAAFVQGFTDEVALSTDTADGEPYVFYGSKEDTEQSNCGFCTEFILRLNAYAADTLDAFKSYLDSMGDSLVFTRDGLDVKAHLHTDDPMAVLNTASAKGTFLTVKVENLKEMCLSAAQSREEDTGIRSARQDITFIATASGDGFHSLYREIGCDCIMEQTTFVGISASDFLRVYDSAPGERVVVLPGNRNIASAARQGAELSAKPERVTVLDIASPAEGYFVMSMADLGEKDGDRLLNGLISNVGCLFTVTVAQATAERTVNGVHCAKGEYIALSDKRLLNASANRLDAAVNAVLSLAKEAETVLIFYGNHVSEEEAQTLSDRLSEEKSDLEIGVFNGGQEECDYYIGIVS